MTGRLTAVTRPIDRFTGRALGRFISFVYNSSSPPPLLEENLEVFRRHHPFILAIWHGQFMLLPALPRRETPIRVMLALHRDAEIMAEALRRHDIELIRGAGAGTKGKDRGGANAFRAAAHTLEQGFSVAMTADVPPGPARRAGHGIVTLAKVSGRPILPVALASSRYVSLNTWSRMTINLPGSRLGASLGSVIKVPPNATAEEMEACRREVEEQLNIATMDAYARAGADPHRATPARMHADLGPVPPGRRLKLYRATTRAARPLAPLLLRWRARRGKELTDRSGERYGIPSKPRPPGPLVWFHAASVGETMTILPLIDALALDRPNHHFLLTTGTVTAANLAADRLGPRMIHQFQPLDVPDYVGAFLDYWRPNLGVFTESEIWPNLILEADARGIALAIVNARMSKTSFRRWRKRPTVALPLFSRFSAVLAQNQTYARHFSDLGARTAVETGNLKIDVPPLPVNEAELARLRAAIGIRPRWLAASTHHDEESIAAGAHVEIAKSAPGLLTILAPRHPERGDAIADAVARAGLKLARRSRGELPAADTEIYLADTLGELGTFYALSPIVFMGKSLSGDGGGGHNPIEPIRLGAAVLTGPSWHNFEDAYRALIASGGTLEVRDGAALASAVVRLLADPDALAQQNAAGLRSINRLTGGLQRTREALERLLPDDGSSPPRDALSLPRREARRAP